MTITTEEHVEKEKDSTSKKPKIMSLKLKGTKKESEKDQEKGTCRHIHWSQDTIDNENMNKKKSNRIKNNNLIQLFILFFKFLFSLLYISSQ